MSINLPDAILNFKISAPGKEDIDFLSTATGTYISRLTDPTKEHLDTVQMTAMGHRLFCQPCQLAGRGKPLRPCQNCKRLFRTGSPGLTIIHFIPIWFIEPWHTTEEILTKLSTRLKNWSLS